MTRRKSDDVARHPMMMKGTGRPSPSPATGKGDDAKREGGGGPSALLGERLRRLEMLLEGRQRVVGISAGRVVLHLRRLLVVGDVLLVVLDHLARERLVELVARELRHLVVHSLVLLVRLGRRGGAQLARHPA